MDEPLQAGEDLHCGGRLIPTGVEAMRSEYAIETYCRFHLPRGFSLTPDLQLVCESTCVFRNLQSFPIHSSLIACLRPEGVFADFGLTVVTYV